MAVIVANAVAMGVEHHNQSENVTRVLRCCLYRRHLHHSRDEDIWMNYRVFRRGGTVSISFVSLPPLSVFVGAGVAACFASCAWRECSD